MIGWLRIKTVKPFLLGIGISVLIGFSLAASCTSISRKQPENENSLQVDSKPREEPIILQPTKQNEGKRCEPKNYYSEFEEGDSTHRECYHLQKRLAESAGNGDLAGIREALKYGANVEGTYYASYPALHTAASSGQVDAVILLLDNGADVNHKVNFEKDPLTMAASQGHADVVKILLARGADVCFKTSSGTAEDIARGRGFKEVAEILKAAISAANCKR